MNIAITAGGKLIARIRAQTLVDAIVELLEGVAVDSDLGPRERHDLADLETALQEAMR